MPNPPYPSVESGIWGRFNFHRSRLPLRIGVLSDAAGIDAWLAPALESLTAPAEIEVGDLFLLPGWNSPGQYPPWLFRKLDNWSRSGEGSGLDASASLPASVRRHELSGGDGPGLAARDRAVIAGQGLDVLLCATAVPQVGNCAGLARFDVWSLLLGEPEFQGFRPPYWREVYEDRSVSRVFLLVHNECFEHGRVVESFAVPTVASLRFSLNEVVPLKAAGLALARNLLIAAERQTAPAGKEEIEPVATPPRWPSTRETAEFICRKLKRSATLRARSRGNEIRWMVGIRRASGAIDYRNPARGEPFMELPNPPGQYYADPFIVESDSRHWLFVENWIERAGRARLACMEVRDDGGFGEPVVILDKPYHLSYPQVFSHRGAFFMIPETCENGDVQLYRATRFPFEWSLEAVLIENARLVDTTAFHYDNHWYFFTSTAEPPEEACLFTSGRIDGDWQYHPANPIGTDTRRLRGAGAVFRAGNSLIRPSQDCSLRYGYAASFGEIGRLSPVEYEERQVGSMLPDWMPGLIGTHTFNSDSGYEVVDGQRFVPASLAGRRKQ